MEWITTFFLTCWDEYLKQDQCLLKLQMLDCKYIIIGGLEQTSTEKVHYHVVGCLPRSFRFETFKRALGSEVHIEKLGRVANAFDYITKEGLYFNNFDEPINNCDEYNAILSEIYMGLSFQDVCKNHPKFAMLHFDNLLKYYDCIAKNIK